MKDDATALTFPWTWTSGHPELPNSKTPLVYYALDQGRFLDSGLTVRLTKEALGFEIRYWYRTDVGAGNLHRQRGSGQPACCCKVLY